MTNRDKGPPNYRVATSCSNCKWYCDIDHGADICEKHTIAGEPLMVCDDYEAKAEAWEGGEG